MENLTNEQWQERLAKDESKSYYVYCRSGGRSQQACMLMNQMGIENTYNLKTGFSEWDGETSKL